jgi:4-amino-4-deoxy-L-arabinose transferase-like glycosyltransferase
MKQAAQLFQNSAGKIYWWIFAFFVFYILAVLIHLNYYPLNGDEPRRAIIAIEMRHSGNFIMPTTMGWIYYNKPPIYNWLISACMFLTGSENEIPIRLPSLIAILLWSIINYEVLKKIVPREVAALSSLFLMTSLDIFFWGLNNGGEIDIFYSFIAYLQVISIFYFNLQKRWTALYLLSYLFCAIGLLTKGFPSILFQGLTLLALCVHNKSIRVLFRWQHLAGIALFFVIAGGYFYAYSFHSSSERFVLNLLKESLDKSAVGDYPERLIRKIIDYPFSLFKILLPWSLLLLLVFKKHHFTFWSHPFIRFSLLFILFNIPVYWLTGHPRMRYSYMFVPFFMTIFAFIFYQFKAAYPAIVSKIFRWMSIVFVAALTLILVLPLLNTVNYFWYVVAILSFGLYLYLYKKAAAYAVWYFGTGIILLRFVFASLYLPARYESIKLNYDKEMASIAAKNDFKPICIYCKPDTLDLSINLKIARFHYDSIPAIPFLAYEVPYYYYKSSRQIVIFDTILRSNINYIGFRSLVKDMNPDILYSFRNPEGEDVVLFRVKEPRQSFKSDLTLY